MEKNVKVKFTDGNWVVIDDKESVKDGFRLKKEAAHAAKVMALTKKSGVIIYNKDGKNSKLIHRDNITLDLNKVDPFGPRHSYRNQDEHDVERSVYAYKVPTDELIYGVSSQTIGNKLDELNAQLKEERKISDQLKRDFHELIYYQQNLIPRFVDKEIRYIPIYIYLSDDNEDSFIQPLIGNVMSEYGLEISDVYETVFGSVFKKLYVATIGRFTKEDVELEISKMKKTADNILHRKVQSEIDNNNADSLAKLLNAIKNQDTAVLRVGNLIVTKTTDSTGQTHTTARELSHEEVLLIEQQTELHKKPDKLLEALKINNEA